MNPLERVLKALAREFKKTNEGLRIYGYMLHTIVATDDVNRLRLWIIYGGLEAVCK
jgi:hypothetical protein